MELDKLLVKVEADLSQLQRGLDEAKRKVNKSTGRMGRDFRDLGNTLANLGGKVIKFGGLLATAFGVIQVAKVVSVGKQIENLQVRLKALFGTADEGARAFDVMVKFASRVPFSLEDIQQASGNLAVVSKDAEELAEILEITGNVASATGLDFRQTAEQIQRSFAGGIASADVFRERGVRAMLGFNAGAKVSINDTIRAFKEKFSGDGEFGQVTADFAQTLTGTLSMLQDKLFSFRKAIADEFMGEIKKQFSELDSTLKQAQRPIEEFGNQIGRELAGAVRFFAENINEIIDGLKNLGIFLASTAGLAVTKFVVNMNKLTLALGLVITFGKEAKETLQDLGVELSKGNAGRFGIANELEQAKILSGEMSESVDDIQEGFKKLSKELVHVNEGVETYAEKWAKISDVTRVAVFAEQPSIANALAKAFEILKGETAEFDKIFDKAVGNIGDAFGDAIAKGEDFGDAMKGIFQDVISQVISLIVQLLVLKPLLDSIKANLGEGGGGFSGIFKDITGMLGFANGGYIAPNKPSIVGEKGAEVFVPQTAGHIVPNHELGGGVNVTQNISFSTGVVPTVRAEVMNMLPLIKQQTITAVAETRSRGGAFAKTFGA